MLKRVTLRQVNMVNDNVDIISMASDVIVMIFEVNMVGSINSDWWVDIGATRHVCTNKSMFHSFRAVDNGEKLYMGNSATADIKDEGDVILKMTSEKELKLNNVLKGYQRQKEQKQAKTDKKRKRQVQEIDLKPMSKPDQPDNKKRKPIEVKRSTKISFQSSRIHLDV
ncbi:hypothetical protein Tco_0520611 [Tanacetum coccineum]